VSSKLIIIISAILGGLALNFLNIPAGAMVGSILGAAISQMITKTDLKIHLYLKRVIRVAMGCYIGLGITLAGVKQLGDIGLAAIIVTIGVISMSLLITFLLYKLCHWELHEAYLSSLPAGLSEIGMTADEFDVDIIKVTTIHLMRLITIVVAMPLIVKILQYLG